MADLAFEDFRDFYFEPFTPAGCRLLPPFPRISCLARRVTPASDSRHQGTASPKQAQYRSGRGNFGKAIFDRTGHFVLCPGRRFPPMPGLRGRPPRPPPEDGRALIRLSRPKLQKPWRAFQPT